MPIRRSLGMFLATLALASVGADAHAQDAVPTASDSPLRPHLELNAIGGYLSPPIHGGTTPFGATLGGRLAYAPSGWVVAAVVRGTLGGDDNGSANHAFLYGGDVGHSFAVPLSADAAFLIRPHVGAGGVSVIHTEPTTSSSSTTTTSRTRGASVSVNVDVVTTASGGTSSSSRGGSSTPTDTTTVTSFYVEPGVALLLSSGSVFAGADFSALVLPSIAYGGMDAATWISYGVTGQLGILF